MCGVKKIFEEGDISNVAVHPAHRGRGISRKMLEILMSEARTDGVQTHNAEDAILSAWGVRLKAENGVLSWKEAE